MSQKLHLSHVLASNCRCLIVSGSAALLAVFSVGLIPQGDALPGGKGVDVQFPWEEWPRRQHHQVLQLHAIFMDEFPVTVRQHLF